MTSAFWGGFAGTLANRMKTDRERKEDEASLEKKMRLQKELEREYETTDVEGTDKASGRMYIAKINGKGEEVGRRFLTDTETENRVNAKRKLLAEITGAEARSDVDVKQARDYDEDHARKVASEKAQERRSEMSLSLQEQSLKNQIGNNALSQAREARMERQYQSQNGPEAYANQKLQQVSTVIANSGVSQQDKNRLMTNANGNINMILAENISDEAKKRKITNVINAMTANLPSVNTQATQGNLDNSGSALPQ